MDPLALVLTLYQLTLAAVTSIRKPNLMLGRVHVDINIVRSNLQTQVDEWVALFLEVGAVHRFQHFAKTCQTKNI